jgi:hypothetical protein
LKTVFFNSVNNRFSTVGLRLVLALVAVIVCVLGGLALFSREPMPPAVVELKRPYSTPSGLRDWIGRWTPQNPGWTWAWQLEDLVFGRRTVVTLATRFFKVRDSDPQMIAALGLGLPQFSNARGVQLWLLPASQLGSLRKLLAQNGMELLNAPRLTTADGISASLFSGELIPFNGITNQVGVEAAYFVRVHAERTDLFASALLTEAVTNSDQLPEGAMPVVSILTNLDVAFRLQIPKSNGVFIIKAPIGPAIKDWFGLIIDPP